MEISCPICGPQLFRKRFTKKHRGFYQCSKCGLEKQHPLPAAAELKAYYEDSYASGMYKAFAAAQLMKQQTAEARLHQLKRFVPFVGKWLDVGCANGVFVQVARNLGLEAEGVELSENAVREAQATGLPVTAGTLADISVQEVFDCITAFDVLEHVLDPELFLSQVVERLKPGGTLVITVPNRRSWSARLMGSRWYFYIPEEHLHYFDRGTLTKLTSKFNLGVVRARAAYKPLTFDYALSQFSEYNPWIFRLLSLGKPVLPKSLRTFIVPVYIGEIMFVARKGF